MIYLDEPYDRDSFQQFLEDQFLPNDYRPTQLQEPLISRGLIKDILNLGTVPSLDNLQVFEVIHTAKADARVTLSNEMVKYMQNNQITYALVAFVREGDPLVWRFSFIKMSPKWNKDGKVEWDKTPSKRYSFLLGKGQHIKTPTQFLIEKGRVKDLEDLGNRFSIETLTSAFYGELYDWYMWASSEEAGVHYPNNSCDPDDDRSFLPKHLIRLITRLMFVWFIKQKGFVPDVLFNEQKLKEDILVSFNPDSYIEGNYYNAILQNLFFASLNKKINERRFAAGHREYGIKTLFRDNDGRKNQTTWFKKSHEDIIKLFEPVPFLNGGLFECLDQIKEEIEAETKNNSKPKIEYYDGFSRDDVPKKRAFVPNALFFANEHKAIIDSKEKTVNGIINIFKKYNFTVEENTSSDIEVALDPELLGKVFENLLAVYNPETGESARKSSGSFYTPREIVDYMVDNSINAYLETVIGKDFETKRSDIKKALQEIKIIDPACGSGAFPMGILNNIMDRLKDIDPELDPYNTKLQLIENCIYGVDIQPIAVQISKLRFFISLICDQKEKNDNPNDNYGIAQLPNLETKFVSANTLIDIEKPRNMSLFGDTEIEEIQHKINRIRHQHFNAKTWEEKHKYRDRDKDLRKELSKVLEANGMDATFELQRQAKEIAKWDPYNQNASAGFFDYKWMFGLEDGFDIVIGNPPYISLEEIKGELKTYYSDTKKWQVKTDSIDLYCLFYEKGMQLLKPNGHLCYITSNKWLRSKYGKGLRHLFSTKYTPKLLVDMGGQVFKSATVDTNILLVQNSLSKSNQTWCWSRPKDTGMENMSDLIEQDGQYMKFTSEPWVILSPIEQSIKAKIEKYGTPLKNWNVNIYRGILTGCNEAFIIDEAKKNELIAKDPNSAQIIRPILRGRDIKRYSYEFANLYLICTFPSKHYDIEQFPAVKDWLINGDWVLPKSPIGTGKLRLEQTGAEHIVGGIKFKSRKKTNNKWFETQDSINYWDDFSKPKIIYQELTQGSRFAIDKAGEYFVSNTAYLLTGDKLQYLLKVLNSRIIEFAFKTYYSTSMGNTGIRWLNQYIMNLPIVVPLYDTEQAITNSTGIEIEQHLGDLYHLSDLEMQFISASVKQ